MAAASAVERLLDSAKFARFEQKTQNLSAIYRRICPHFVIARFGECQIVAI
ncbi:hypothetical protein [Helicobacter sp. 23-1045]